ncbi:Y-family DNA polymerase [Roseibium algae]|uniref:DNA-directed DNA polymerase n=1 Tax=Roseibium algae TaxID=3123038 RepID=A0ABU8TRR7_9HYPH
MRKPETIERLYLDFDGFFASVMQQAYPKLRGRPVGVVPFEGTDRTVVIACSKEAKAAGCTNVMKVLEARQKCPSLVLVPQEPDLFRRAHNALLSEISAVIPIDAIKSIDELTCRLDERQRQEPEDLAATIKDRIARFVGIYITCSIGFAANRHLAKIACKMDKPNGVTIWHPNMMPQPLYPLPFDDIPGIGERMKARLNKLGVYDMQRLLALQPKHMRKIWRNVTGERLWYALHGYDIQAGSSERGMYGHGRVLPPDLRTMKEAREIARILLVKAARRMRRENFAASGLVLWLAITNGSFGDGLKLPAVRDDKAFLDALDILWHRAEGEVAWRKVYRVHVTLIDLTPAKARQLDMLLDDDRERQRWEHVTDAQDDLNRKYSGTIVSTGWWNPPKGGNVGGKISYTRIPRAEDFW